MPPKMSLAPETIAEIRARVDGALAAPGPDVADRVMALVMECMTGAMRGGYDRGHADGVGAATNGFFEKLSEPAADGSRCGTLNLVRIARTALSEIDKSSDADATDVLAAAFRMMMDLRDEVIVGALSAEHDRVAAVANAPRLMTGTARDRGLEVERYIRASDTFPFLADSVRATCATIRHCIALIRCGALPDALVPAANVPA